MTSSVRRTYSRVYIHMYGIPISCRRDHRRYPVVYIYTLSGAILRGNIYPPQPWLEEKNDGGVAKRNSKHDIIYVLYILLSTSVRDDNGCVYCLDQRYKNDDSDRTEEKINEENERRIRRLNVFSCWEEKNSTGEYV